MRILLGAARHHSLHFQEATQSLSEQNTEIYVHFPLYSLHPLCVPLVFLEVPTSNLEKANKRKFSWNCLPAHRLWLVAGQSPCTAPVAFILLWLGLAIPLIMLGWPPTGKKKSLARLFPQETFQVSNELGQIGPLGMCGCSRISLAKNPMDIHSQFSHTAWFEHLIWSQKRNKSLERSGLTSASPNCFLPHPHLFFFHFQSRKKKKSLQECDKVLWVLKSSALESESL